MGGHDTGACLFWKWGSNYKGIFVLVVRFMLLGLVFVVSECSATGVCCS